MNITCPYCFSSIEDDKVLFRSEYVSSEDKNPIPIDFDTLEAFKERYEGDTNPTIQAKIKEAEEWDFFREQEDKTYEQWWEVFGQTSENDSADEIMGVKAYRRRIINPSIADHGKYLKKQSDGSFFVKDDQGMVVGVESATGQMFTRRVCPHCHNPFPNNYGKYPVKFVTVVGVQGAGKTVYLSQLLGNMRQYATKVGLSAIVRNVSIENFRRANQVEKGKPVPAGTPVRYLQQPLFYEIVRNTGTNTKVTETFVMYDVAGEVVTNEALLNNYAPFIANSDGIILLIDPMQFSIMTAVGAEGDKKSEPEKVLEVIHNRIFHDEDGKKNSLPIAVCISKCDKPEMAALLGQEVTQCLIEPILGLKDADMVPKTLFNATQYNPIGKGINDFMVREPDSDTESLAFYMRSNYTKYAWFAFSAMGCGVEKMIDDNGIEFETPIGPIQPRHIEEPILWLFHQLGYIGTNESIYTPLPTCPSCGSTELQLFNDTQIEVVGGIFRRREIQYNAECRCGHKWMRNV